jgi:hypothetical protein
MKASSRIRKRWILLVKENITIYKSLKFKSVITSASLKEATITKEIGTDDGYPYNIGILSKGQSIGIYIDDERLFYLLYQRFTKTTY